MLFTIDVGNTNIVFGVFEGEKLLFTARLQTNTYKMSDEYAVDFFNIMKLHNCSTISLRGAAISSVVPSLIPVLRDAVKTAFSCDTLVASNRINTGLEMLMDTPDSVGADLICGAVAANRKYPDKTCIIFDLGTATTICAVDKDRRYLGGSIYPGVNVAHKALAANTAQLPHINLDEPCESVIGKNTVAAMRNGLLYGTASFIDGMSLRYREELSQPDAIVIATGGLSTMIVPYCRTDIVIDNNLILDGLKTVYEMNN